MSIQDSRGRPRALRGSILLFLSLSQSLFLVSSVPFLLLLLALPLCFFLILEKQPSSRRKKQKESFGKNVKRHPGVQQADERADEQQKECMRELCVCLCVCVTAREKTTGWRRPPPTVARGREKHSLSLFGLLAHSHPPLLSLSLSLDSARMAPQPPSLPLSLLTCLSLSLPLSQRQKFSSDA